MNKQINIPLFMREQGYESINDQKNISKKDLFFSIWGEGNIKKIIYVYLRYVINKILVQQFQQLLIM